MVGHACSSNIQKEETRGSRVHGQALLQSETLPQKCKNQKQSKQKRAVAKASPSPPAFLFPADRHLAFRPLHSFLHANECHPIPGLQCVLKGEKAREYESTLFLVLNPVCSCTSCPEEQGREMQLRLLRLLKGNDWQPTHFTK